VNYYKNTSLLLLWMTKLLHLARVDSIIKKICRLPPKVLLNRQTVIARNAEQITIRNCHLFNYT